MRARAGVTLVELLVALAILGITGGMVLLAFPRGETSAAEVNSVRSIAAEARRLAITTGRPQRVVIQLTQEGTVRAERSERAGTQQHSVIALPDGGVIASDGLSIDRLSGRRRESPRTR